MPQVYMFKSVGVKTPLCITYTSFELALSRCNVPKGSESFVSLMWFAMNLLMVLVCMSLLMSLCMLTVSSATVIVRVGCCFWLEPAAMVLLMLSM